MISKKLATIALILLSTLILTQSSIEGSWVLNRLEGQQVSIKDPIQFEISLQIIEDPNGSDKKIVRNRLEIQGCITFNYLFRTIGSNFYLDKSSYRYIKPLSRTCSPGENRLMMLVYRYIQQAFYFEQEGDVLQFNGMNQVDIFTLVKLGSSIQKKQEQAKTLQGEWQIYKVNRKDMGLRYLVEADQNQIYLCQDNVKIGYKLNQGDELQINFNEDNAQSHRDCSDSDKQLIQALRQARFFRNRGKFAAIFNQGISPIIEMKNLALAVPPTAQSIQKDRIQSSSSNGAGYVQLSQTSNEIIIAQQPKIQVSQVEQKVKDLVEDIREQKIVISQQVKEANQDITELQQAQIISRPVIDIEMIKKSISGKWYPAKIYGISPPSSQIHLLISQTEFLINGCNMQIFSYQLQISEENELEISFGPGRSTRRACQVDDDQFYLRALRNVKSGEIDPILQNLILKDARNRPAFTLTKQQVKEQKPSSPEIVIEQPKVEELQKVEKNESKLELTSSQNTEPNTQIKIKQAKESKEIPIPVIDEQKQEGSHELIQVNGVSSVQQKQILPIGQYISMLLKKRALSRLYAQISETNVVSIESDCGSYSSQLIFDQNGQNFSVKLISSFPEKCQSQSHYEKDISQCSSYRYNQNNGILFLIGQDGENLVWMKKLK